MQLKLKMDVILDKKNDLLKRREVKVIIHSSGNPGYEGARKAVDEQFKAKPEVTVINTLKSKFGRDTFLIDAFIYDSEEDRNKFHVPEEKPAEEAPAEGVQPKAEEKPAEAPKEEAKPAEEKAEAPKEEADKGGSE